uniref:RRM domain-containing protein n=1 Tax=Quercus lobata TaxID=97700 RepID=A0A7N2M2M1_QUELO
MEDVKKRKVGEAVGNGETSSTSSSEEEMRLLLDPLPKPQLVHLLSKLGSQYPSIAEEIRSIASADPVHRKLFVRGLAWNTTSETLCAAFQVHGEIEEGAVISDKTTGKSRGYGFITFKHMESAHNALKAPSKMIDGRLAVCNLACEGLSGASTTPDLAQRKLYIGGLSPNITSEELLKYFEKHGDIEEGSVAYDKDTNVSRGFGFVTYKTVEAAKKAIDDPNKILGVYDHVNRPAFVIYREKYELGEMESGAMPEVEELAVALGCKIYQEDDHLWNQLVVSSMEMVGGSKYGVGEGRAAQDWELDMINSFELVCLAWVCVGIEHKGRNIIVKLADSHKGKSLQTQLPTAVVPMALPMAAGYPQPGNAHVSTTPVAYTYPQTVASYPVSSYPSPPTAPAPYQAQPQISYAPVTLKKESLGLPSTPMGIGGYPYYLSKQ